MQPVRMSPAPQADDPKVVLEARKRKEAIRGFEEMFVAQMLKTMRQTVPEGEESRAKALWREQFDAEIAKRIADGRGIGLAPLLEKGIDSAGGRNGRKR